MRNTIAQHLAGIGSENDRNALRAPLAAIAANLNTMALTSSGLGIKTATSALAKTGAAITYLTVSGVLVAIPANTDMPALTGLNIGANRFNVACFFVNGTGTLSALFGTEAATMGAVKWPDFPIDRALVGVALITHSSAFTGGTTALDTATTVYLSPVGAFDPTFLAS